MTFEHDHLQSHRRHQSSPYPFKLLLTGLPALSNTVYLFILDGLKEVGKVMDKEAMGGQAGEAGIAVTG